jgi:hypothetical protein
MEGLAFSRHTTDDNRQDAKNAGLLTSELPGVSLVRHSISLSLYPFTPLFNATLNRRHKPRLKPRWKLRWKP